MATDLLQSLKSASLLPSPVLLSTFTPTYNLTVSFPSISPQNGALVRVHQVSTAPKITVTPTDPTHQPDASTYTFLLIDPDAPTPADPKFAFWRHWVVSSISLPQSPDQDITEAGTTVTPYLAPGPKDESGPHRYLFVLLREREGTVVSKEDVGGDEFVERRSFGVEKFVKEKGLDVVGVQWMRGVGDGWVEGKTEL